MEVQNLIVDAGTLTVYNSEFIAATINDLDETTKTRLVLKCFLTLKDEILKSKNEEEAANELKKLQHQFKDFDIAPNETTLPKTKLLLPRFQKCEKVDTLTKWEKYAREKGIQKKKKRSKLVWSDEMKDWVPRWGHKGIKQIQEDMDIIREIKPQDNPDVNPFNVSRDERKMRLNKQRVKEAQNKLRGAGLKPSEFGGDYEDKKASGTPKQFKKTRDSEIGKKAIVADRKKKIDKKINHSKVATGSLGVYKGETDVYDKKTKKVRHRTLPVIKNTREEKKRTEDLLRRVFNK